MQALHHLWQLLLFLILLSGPVPLSQFLITLQKDDATQVRLSHRALAFLTYWCVLEVTIGLVLGILGQFFLIPVLIAEFLVLGVGVALLFSAKRLALPVWKEPFTIQPHLSGTELLIVGAFSFTGCVLLERLVTLPIIDYDSLWYHLPIMARWYQAGAFVRLPDFMSTGVWTTDQIAYYPFNWEILCTLFVMPFQEDFLVALPNLLVWAMLGLATYGLGQTVGATRVYNLAATTLVLTIPLILQHVNTLHIDLPFATFFMISLYFAISYHKTRSPFDIGLFLASFGMLLGIKLSAVGYGILPVLALLLLEVRSFLTHRKLPRWFNTSTVLAISILLVGMGSVFLIGGFWYFRNWAEVGNPLGNVQVQVAGLSFPGSAKLSDLHQTSLASLFKFTNPSHLKILLTQSIARLQLPFMALLLQLLLLPGILWVKDRKYQLASLLGTGLLLLANVYLYWTTPMTGTHLFPSGPITSYIGQQVRFAISSMALLGVVAATIASILQTRLAIVVPVVLASSILGIVSSSIFEIIRTETAFKGGVGWASKILDGFRTNPAGATDQVMKLVGSSLLDVIIYVVLFVLVMAIIAWTVWGKLKPTQLIPSLTKLLQRSRQVAVSAFLIGLLITATGIAREKRDIERHEIYRGVYDYIADFVGRDETIGYLLSYRSYFFYGKFLNQKVAYVPSHADSLAGWLKELKQRQISLVAVGPLEEKMGWRESRELQWLTSSPQHFQRVFGQDPQKEPVFYRLIDPKPEISMMGSSHSW
ncbi:MAG: hypothetical protein KME16_02130 [Scytolyngbya sp. HA4215-MV1]|jgi:hypothetical protein|nr:hypothetical protein [Scytolyngbya sp. HA4215-MV1]